MKTVQTLLYRWRLSYWDGSNKKEISAYEQRGGVQVFTMLGVSLNTWRGTRVQQFLVDGSHRIIALGPRDDTLRFHYMCSHYRVTEAGVAA